MPKVKVITDFCADLDNGLREKYGVDCVRSIVTVSGREFRAPEFDDRAIGEFYAAIKAGESATISVDPSLTPFEQIFTKYVESGYDVLYIASYDAFPSDARAVRSVVEKHVGAKVMRVECGLGSAKGLVALETAKYAAHGADIADVAAFAGNIKTQVFGVCAGAPDAFKRAGVMSSVSAFFAKLFGMTPVITINADCGMSVAKKIRGDVAALDACISIAQNSIAAGDGPLGEQTVIVSHVDDPEAAEYVADRIKELIAPKAVYICRTDPLTGAALGVGTVAIHGFGKLVTATEKK